MPRKELDLPYRVNHLSILDAEGQIDKELEPQIADDVLLELHRWMLLARRFDERLLTLQRQGKIGTFAPIKGQEASQVGAVALLQPEDWLVPSFREMAAEIMRGKSLENVLLSFAGYNEGGQISPESHSLPPSVPVGTQMLHAVGLGYGIKYRKKKQVVVTFFGDGATSQGDFHEAMNFAGVFQVPVIFLCQNNQWAISVPRAKQTRSQTLAQKALAYGIPGIQVDGNDVLAVYVAGKGAIERARAGGGPTLIEAVTYRMSVHTTADDPKRYRKDEEVELWVKRDPITRFRKYLQDKELLDSETIAELEDQVKTEIKEVEKRWQQRMQEAGDPLQMFDHVFAEQPPYLREQKAELSRELEEKQA